MDVARPPGRRQHPPRGRLLPGARGAQHAAQDPARRHPHGRDARQVPCGRPAPEQRAHVSAHVRPQLAEGARAPPGAGGGPLRRPRRLHRPGPAAGRGQRPRPRRRRGRHGQEVPVLGRYSEVRANRIELNSRERG